MTTAKRMRRRLRRTAWFSLLTMLLAGACGGTGDVTPATEDQAVTMAENSEVPSEPTSPTPSEKPELPSDAEVEQFFSALSTYDYGGLRKAMTLAEKDSLAHAYAGYIFAYVNAGTDGGTPFEGTPVGKVDGGYESCDASDPTDCVTWTDIEGRDGKIVAFKVSGKAVGKRLSAGDGTTIKADALASVKFLYAYQSVQSDSMNVLVGVRSGAKPITIGAYQATYRDPTGRQITASATVGPTDLAAHSRTTVAMQFRNARPGGMVTLPVFSDDFATQADAQFRTR